MTTQIIQPEDVTLGLLRGGYEAAFMDVQIDDGGQLIVGDGGLTCYVMPMAPANGIRLLAAFQLSPDSTATDRAAFMNKIHNELIMLRLAETDGRLFVDYYLMMPGGTTMRSVVGTTKQFLQAMRDMVARNQTGVLA